MLAMVMDQYQLAHVVAGTFVSNANIVQLITGLEEQPTARTLTLLSFEELWHSSWEFWVSTEPSTPVNGVAVKWTALAKDFDVPTDRNVTQLVQSYLPVDSERPATPGAQQPIAAGNPAATFVRMAAQLEDRLLLTVFGFDTRYPVPEARINYPCPSPASLYNSIRW